MICVLLVCVCVCVCVCVYLYLYLYINMHVSIHVCNICTVYACILVCDWIHQKPATSMQTEARHTFHHLMMVVHIN